MRSQFWVGLAIAMSLVGCGNAPDASNSEGGGSGAGGKSGAGGGSGAGGSVAGAAGTGGGGANAGSAGVGGASGAGGASGVGGTSGAGGASGTGGASGASGAGGAANDSGAPEAGGSSGSDAGSTSWWKPTAGTTWDWQLSSTDLSHAVQVYDIDYENDAMSIDTLHGKGIHVICYVSVGSWEDYRPDASSFPAAVVGNDYPGWPGEKFVDIRAPELRSIMSARFDICKQKGFDGLEPDNMDVFEDNSGFPLTMADGLDYANWLASQAHSRGMAIFQKNTSDIATSLFDLYDGAITEDCYDQNWCSDMLGYATRNKPVFMAEYTDTGVDFTAACTWAKTNHYSAILKDRDLTSALTTCP